MTTKDKRETSGISLIEAVETLSSIADIDLAHSLGITQEHSLTVQDTTIKYRTIHWLESQDSAKTIEMIKEVFKVILNYLKNFYAHDYRAVHDSQTVEGIKTIMVLVGEAAKKLDKYTHLFNKAKAASVTELKEYKQLQEFYLSRIARKVDEGMLGKWLLGLAKTTWGKKPAVKLDAHKSLQTKHVFVDLDSVKRDTEYELFFMRKEDGTRFFSPRLIRNIKLVCDFGSYFGGAKTVPDPLEDLNYWQDRIYQTSAKHVLKHLGYRLSRFYREALKFKDREFVECLNKALMALMLAANPRNQLRNSPLKCCGDYFADFQRYLRDAFQSRDCLKLLTYPPKKSSKLAHCLLDVAHGLCMALFSGLYINQEVSRNILSLIEDARLHYSNDHGKSNNHQLNLMWNHLSRDYHVLSKYLKMHPNGPLVKVLGVLEEGGHMTFDAIRQHNLPSQQYALCIGDTRVSNIRMPCPTNQDFIHKASIVDEFKGFVRACARDSVIRHHLLINMQDRTSWKEHVRSAALEDLQQVDELKKHLTVVTIPKDTDFYHQLPPYQKDNHAEVFIEHLKEQLADLQAGFYFPEELRKALSTRFVDGIISAIHRIFFSGKNILLREHRLDFIEIFYMFLQLKLIDIIAPDSFSMSCKDSVDAGAAANAQLYAFIKLINVDKWTEIDRDNLNMILYTPGILVRERIVQPERFNRMISALKAVETVREQYGHDNFALIVQEAFREYYKTPILKAKATLPRQ